MALFDPGETPNAIDRQADCVRHCLGCVVRSGRMNRLSRISSATFDIGEGAYRMSPADFLDGCFVRTDAHTGRRIGTGQNCNGLTITVPLDTWLCSGCDQPLDNGVCSDCQMIFVDALHAEAMKAEMRL